MARLTMNRHRRRLAALARYPKAFVAKVEAAISGGGGHHYVTGSRTEQQWSDERKALEANISKGGGR